ncbi:neutral/alkaline non-lysosomal ceramidase N-terminal domain-containing protein [Flammeovirga sp. SubArs3]|uniref:neutral/alkaline non-lysosomal ceramidase N-terminal domain-containing protein n=1 Tax=Flammeovirga sp. SubArs3 TaxID=2995316 RepID=UPI00248BAB4B|nr:neutral/alkaline non-lysosomal ceramidase N-terminal domain-containing protein [Flammeovirga sp. SubArs3]
MKKAIISVSVILILAFSLIGTIDRTPLKSTEEYKKTFLNVAETIKELEQQVSTDDTLQIGWAKECIIPKGVPLPVAGYGFRTQYRAVRDSLYARAFAFDDGIRQTYVLSLDLMIFPTEVRKRLGKKLLNIGITEEDVLFSATHTHNGMGGFDPSLLGNVAMGIFSEEGTSKIVASAYQAILNAKASKKKGSVGFLKTQSPEWVTNRIVYNGRKENSIRGIKINRVDGKNAAIVTYNAHPTHINMNYWILSRDYPGEWINHLEASKTIDFAAFCAGMVASHGPGDPKHIEDSFERIKDMGSVLSDSILHIWDKTQTNAVVNVDIHKIPIDFRPSQIRIESNLKVRDWVFKSASDGGLQGDITLMRIGNIDWFACPSDFSGEIALDYQFDRVAHQQNKEFMVTSFNGNYAGYITCDAYYDSLNSYEIREMNWVGPEYGAYFGEIIKELLEN